MLYFAGIRALGESEYREVGNCLEGGFYHVLKRAAVLQKRYGLRMFVDFRQRPHTFEIKDDGTPHLLTPEDTSMVDPAASFLESGD